MSNKLIKSKADKKIEYLEKHCKLLEKENQQLKERNTELEIRISFFEEGVNSTTNDTKNIIEKALIAKKTYNELNNRLHSVLTEENEKIVNITKIEKEYNKKLIELDSIVKSLCTDK